MMKYIITKEQLKIITENIILLKEQGTAGCEYKNWQNGDGVSKPKITISQSEAGFEGTFEGPETGFCVQHSKGGTSDTIHQLAGVARVIVSPLLKQLYSQGKYVKPDLKKIEMTKKNNYFKIIIPFIKTTEDKAITNFNERGGWGHSGQDTLKDFLSTIENNPKYGLIEKETKIASGGNSSDITETWVSFRDLDKYPIKTVQIKSNQEPITITPSKTVEKLKPTENPQKNNKDGKKPLKPLNVISPEKYSGRIGEQVDGVNVRPKYDAILVGGIDDKKGFFSIDKQLEIFKQGFGNRNVKAFRYTVPADTILSFLKLNPRIPIFLFSAGCNLADELVMSELVNKNKVYVIEPYNKENFLNSSVRRAITNGLSPRNIFVKRNTPSRGYGFSGASDSEANSHWDALRSIGEKFK